MRAVKGANISKLILDAKKIAGKSKCFLLNNKPISYIWGIGKIVQKYDVGKIVPSLLLYSLVWYVYGHDLQAMRYQSDIISKFFCSRGTFYFRKFFLYIFENNIFV